MQLPMYRSRFAAMLGNFFEHYDSALFGLLSPFLAPLFFEGTDPVTALILTYGLLPLGLITRPLGALFFGWIGDSVGRSRALFLSLTAVAITTVLMGCIPLYREIGVLAPCLLALGRMLQGFFSAGEVPGGAIFILEQTALSKRSFASSCYDALSIGGALFASGVIALMSGLDWIEAGWRYLFWAGGATALVGAAFRSDRLKEIARAPMKREKIFSILRKNFWPFLAIFFVAGFSYTTYSLPFTLMNGFVPLVTSVSRSDVMHINTWLLLYDMCLLPIMGHLAGRFGKEKIMLVGCLGAALFALPLFSLLDGASLGLVIALRLAIITFGVAFSAPYYAWAIEQVAPQHRYLILSLAGALGSQLIGMPSSAMCLWLYQTFGSTAAAGLYLAAAAMFAGLAVFFFMHQKSWRPFFSFFSKD